MGLDRPASARRVEVIVDQYAEAAQLRKAAGAALLSGELRVDQTMAMPSRRINPTDLRAAAHDVPLADSSGPQVAARPVTLGRVGQN